MGTQLLNRQRPVSQLHLVSPFNRFPKPVSGRDTRSAIRSEEESAGNGARVATLRTALSAASLPLSAASVWKLVRQVVVTVSTVCNDFVVLISPLVQKRGRVTEFREKNSREGGSRKKNTNMQVSDIGVTTGSG